MRMVWDRAPIVGTEPWEVLRFGKTTVPSCSAGGASGQITPLKTPYCRLSPHAWPTGNQVVPAVQVVQTTLYGQVKGP